VATHQRPSGQANWAYSRAQAEQHRQELAQEGVSWGLNHARIIERLRLRIQPDEAYLSFGERKGQHTLTDDAIAGDLRVFALAIAYLEQPIRES
jgi:hypothetical protein